MTATAAEMDQQIQVTVPARTAAIGWVNAFLATSQEIARPVLYRTLSVEVFEAGVQFVSCDGTALFRSWVPFEGAPWPHDLLRPRSSFVVMDPDGFGIGFMKSLLRVTADDRALAELTITTSPCDDLAELALGAEFQTARVSLRSCGQRIDLQLFDGPYVGWRHLDLGIFGSERVDGMTVASRLLSMVGKLKGISAVDLEFHGENRRIGFVARGDSWVRGVLMPMRRGKGEQSHGADEEGED